MSIGLTPKWGRMSMTISWTAGIAPMVLDSPILVAPARNTGPSVDPGERSS